MTLDAMLDRLAAGGAQIRRTVRGVVATCPAHHPDRRPSLMLTEGPDKLLAHCRSGCATSAVLAALGLDFGALYPTTQRRAARPPRPRPVLDVMRETALAMARRQVWARPEIRARYVAAGALKWCDRWGPPARAAEAWALVALIDSLAIRAALLWARAEARR